MAGARRSITIEIFGEAKGFQRSTQEATKSLGKMEAALGGVGKTMAGALSVGAVVSFGKNAIDAFTGTALAAGKMADATGLSVEQASRWREVSEDMGVSADSLTVALGRMSKTLETAPGTFDRYGIAVARTRAGLVDVNATFLNLVNRLNEVPDPAKRAAIATATLGRGWQEMAELISTGSAELTEQLGAVSETKVIDEKELANAKVMRERLDAIADSFQEIAIQAGESLLPVVQFFAKLAELNPIGRKDELVEMYEADKRAKKDAAAAEREVMMAVDASTMALAGLTTQRQAAIDQEAAFNAGLARTAEGYGRVAEAAQEWREAAEAAVAADVLRRMEGAARAAAGAIEAVDQAWTEMTEGLDDETSWLDIQDAFAGFVEEMAAFAEIENKTEQDWRNQRRAVIELKQAVAEYAQEVGDIPPSQVTTINAMIDAGSIAQVEQMLAILTRNRAINIQIMNRGGIGYGDLNGGPRALGGPVQAGTTYMVGERGPELFTATSNGVIRPNGGMGTNVIVNVTGSVVTERQLVDAIHEGLLRKQRKSGALALT